MAESEAEIRRLEKQLSKSKYEPIESPLGKIKLFKDKDGNKITTKEFFSRWAEGIKNLTPIQKLTNESRATFITLIGSIVCLVALIIFRDKLIVNWFAYGLILVFVGNSWSQGVKWLSLKQQLRFFKDTDDQALNIEDIMGKLNSPIEEVVKGGNENEQSINSN